MREEDSVVRLAAKLWGKDPEEIFLELSPNHQTARVWASKDEDNPSRGFHVLAIEDSTQDPLLLFQSLEQLLTKRLGPEEALRLVS